MRPHFDHTPARRYCESKGLVWDASAATDADAMAKKHGLNQVQFTAAVCMHVDRMLKAWTPRNYPWRTRLAIALYWLGLVKPRRK